MLLKRVNTIDSDKQNFNKKLKMLIKKIPDTSNFIATQEFNRLTKIIFHARMAEASKKLATKKQIENALDIENKSTVKMKQLQIFDLSYFIGKSYFDDDGSESYLIFQTAFKY